MAWTQMLLLLHVVMPIISLAKGDLQYNFEKQPNKLREKRYIKWEKDPDNPKCYNIQGSRVCYLKPHPNTTTNIRGPGGFTGFTLYRRRDQDVLAEGGYFHFVGTNEATIQAQRCQRKTLHAGAYRSIYDSCPEQEDGGSIVASGYCYVDEVFATHSYTFNALRDYNPYLDSKYYASEENQNTNDMNTEEVRCMEFCLKEWTKAEQPTEDWECRFDKNQSDNQLCGPEPLAHYDTIDCDCVGTSCTRPLMLTAGATVYITKISWFAAVTMVLTLMI